MHNVKNALAAAACALSAGVSVQAVTQGLETFVPVKGRSRAVALSFADRTRTLVDDTYNANPDSMRAAIQVLADLPGPRLLVLGDMGEVGNQGPEFHAEVVAYAAEAGQFQQAGFSTVICGPGSVEQAHQPNEFLAVSELERGLAVFNRFMEKMRG